MTTTDPSTRLNDTERSVAEHLVTGARPEDIVKEVSRAPYTVRAGMSVIRVVFGCPPGTARHVLVHTLLTSHAGRFAPPVKDGQAPQLTADQLTLLQAVSQHSHLLQIAQNLGVTRKDLKQRVDDLHALANTEDLTGLVVWGHTWGLLGSRRDAVSAGDVNR